MVSQHHYAVDVQWTGDRGTGTSGYRDYDRTLVIRASGKPELAASADPTFRGDADRWNPEELLVASLSQCHMLSFFHVAVQHGVVVTGYTDRATGHMETLPDGSGRFVRVDLHPAVVLLDEAQRELADSLHPAANRLCFIANSVNFPVHHAPERPTVVA